MEHQHAAHETRATYDAPSVARSGKHAHHALPESEYRAHADHAGHEHLFRQRFWVSLLFSLPVLYWSPALQEWLHYRALAFPFSDWITPIFAIIVFAYGGVPFIQMAFPEIQSRRPGMMTLITLAIGVAFTYSLAVFIGQSGEGFFWELVTLIDVMLLGHWLEMRSVRQASGALNELAKLMPDTAERIREDGNIESVAASELGRNDLVLVRPGASVPADGKIEEGESQINEAMITGESRPVSKRLGDAVIAGTINGDRSLRVRVTAVGESTTLAGIMRLVRDAQQSKSQTQILADRAAGWLFYVAVAAAIITGVAWSALTGFNAGVVTRVATVLVIACPHALGLAIPLVVAITTSLGARVGILIRDRRALEQARLIDTIVFDKTGTLTKGEQGVVSIATDGIAEKDALALAAGIEGDSEHIIARAIRQAAGAKHIAPAHTSEFQALRGRGVQARFDGRTVHLGGPRLLEMFDREISSTLKNFVNAAEEKGQTVVSLVQDEKVTAVFALADVIRPESKDAIRNLHKMGVQVAMLTGDSDAVARAVARELGIDRYFSQVLPEDKDKKIIELQEQGKRVAMVGDGVNDAPALTRADVGIAIGSGTDVAVESAGIILVKSNPLDVVKIIQLSRASYGKMIQNLFWATGYNVIAIPLAAGILAPLGILPSPALGAVFMTVSTIIVALNAQLLRRVQLVV